MTIEEGKLSFDIRNRPVGYQWGGKMRASVACPVCSKPALLLPKKTKTQGDTIAHYAHVVHYSLDAKNDAVADFGAPCLHNETRAAKAR